MNKLKTDAMDITEMCDDHCDPPSHCMAAHAEYARERGLPVVLENPPVENETGTEDPEAEAQPTAEEPNSSGGDDS